MKPKAPAPLVPRWAFVVSMIVAVLLGFAFGSASGNNVGALNRANDRIAELEAQLAAEGVAPAQSGGLEEVTFAAAGVGNSVTEYLSGDYIVSWETFGDCVYYGSIDDDITLNVFSADTVAHGENYLYDVRPGNHFVAVNTGPVPACAWSVTLTPN